MSFLGLGKQSCLCSDEPHKMSTFAQPNAHARSTTHSCTHRWLVAANTQVISVCSCSNQLCRESLILKFSVRAGPKKSIEMQTWAPVRSLQGARLKAWRVLLERGMPMSCCSGPLEPVLTPFLTTYTWKSGVFPIYFDLWHHRLSCM